ncbi:MAG: hypothetical protein AABY15_00375 [Nanoarchaeota archaeon]
MYTLLIFLILTLAEGIYIWMKWDEIQEYKEIGQEVAKATKIDQDHRYKTVVQFLGKLWNYAKPMFVFLGIVLLFVNLIIALILGVILNFII